MQLMDGHPIPDTRTRHDYSNLLGWQIGQCIVVDGKTSLRIKAYFERTMKWRFTQRKEPGDTVRLWRRQ